MKRTLATCLALLCFALVCHAGSAFYFGTWEASEGDNYAFGLVYATETETGQLSVTLIQGNSVLQTRKGALNRSRNRFSYTHSDGRKMLLTYGRKFPYRWKGSTKLVNAYARIHMTEVPGPLWETLGYPPSP